jgi:hypothetical protein
VTPQKVQLKGDLERRDFDLGTQSLVKAACDRWWNRYGNYQTSFR